MVSKFYAAEGYVISTSLGLNMMKNILILPALLISLMGIGQHGEPFSLEDFYKDHAGLDLKVEHIYMHLTPEERVAQMIVSSLGSHGKSYETVKPLIEQRKVGGVIFLSGDPMAFKNQISEINDMSVGWPLLFSMDAEPSLFNRRLPGTPEMPPTNQLKTKASIVEAVSTIDSVLHEVGFHQNFAPVVDLSSSNEAIGNRNFGLTPAEVIPRAESFIHATQADGIVACAKHFPGHGRVAGDTHKKLVYINGELTELEVYPPMIAAGVLSIMVGHIAIENNQKYQTDGMPATLSPVVVTKLLRNELGFKGIIITDALNMGAVAAIPHHGLLAAKAGCDMILMPPDEEETLSDILAAMENDPDFSAQIEASVKRIIRLKLCLNQEF